MQSSSSIAVASKISKPKKIEVVNVCVCYADFLAWTLPFNKNQFERLVIVTTPEDTETQRLCEYWHVECVTSSAFYGDGAVFNKGKGINDGLKRLDKDGWVLHFDSDIYMLPRTREVLNLLPLDEKGIYSCDRINCVGFENWAKYIQSPELAHANTGFLGMNAFENGARLLNLGRDGYVPIGYFQLWNPQGSGVTEYPKEHGAADRSDTLFAYNWTRENRHLIPELVVIHLESDDSTMGANWKGRTTAPFVIKNKLDPCVALHFGKTSRPNKKGDLSEDALADRIPIRSRVSQNSWTLQMQSR